MAARKDSDTSISSHRRIAVSLPVVPSIDLAAEAGVSRQCLGKWVARYREHALFRWTVGLSELCQAVLSDCLTERLGWGWEARERAHV